MKAFYMSKRKCVFALVFVGLIAQCALAQQQAAFVCFTSVNAAQLATSHANCPTVVTPDPGSIGVFPVSQVFGAQFSGTLTGDLGQIEAATLSIPCTSQPFLQLTTIYSPGIHTVKAQFTGCFDFPGTYTGTLIVVVPPYTSPHGTNPPPPPPPCGVTMIDPISSVPKLWLGDHITNRPFDLANASGVVQGVAADGVTEALLRINTTDGANVTINLSDSSGGSSTSPDEIGSLAGVDGGTPASSITVTAHDGGSGPYAYVLYQAPLNFTRANTAADAEVFSRQVQLQTSCEDSNGTTTATTPVKIVRPPIILVHGLWSSASDAWNNFVPVKDAENTFWSNLPVNSVLPVNYDVPPDSPIISTVPSYSNSITNAITRNSLGFAYNAPFVFKTIQDYLDAFEGTFNVAVVQADVVAHSMGGDIARTMVTLPDFSSGDTYGQGLIHKLITIATPHQGTPLAAQMLSSDNTCVEKGFALSKEISLANVTFQDMTSTVGAVQDLETGVAGTIPFPIAYVAGAAVPSINFANLGKTGQSKVLSIFCGTLARDPLALALSQADWPTIFAPADDPIDQASDGIVPVTSQFNGTTNLLGQFPDAIHSASLEKLGFGAPAELDSQSGIPDWVVDLLNDKTSDINFQH